MGFQVWPFLDEESFLTINVADAQGERQERKEMRSGSGAKELWPVGSQLKSPMEEWTRPGCV